MSSKNRDIKEYNINGLDLEAEIQKEQQLLEEQELKVAKLKKKMLIFGIVLLVLVAAYIALALYNKAIV
ncbi:MAG: hypothetical protein MJ130_02575 [Lachnospiraceae bacterium]|nr:hypothetical protein [Lachnospiraceae bacterium]